MGRLESKRHLIVNLLAVGRVFVAFLSAAKEKKKTVATTPVYTLRPHIDWIALIIALLLGLLYRYVNFPVHW